MKALGRENIDEVIKLSEDYKSQSKLPTALPLGVMPIQTHPYSIPQKHILTGLASLEVEFAAPRSEAGTVFEEYRKEVLPSQNVEIIEDTKVVERHSPSPARSTRSHHHHHSSGVNVIDAGPRDESTFYETRKDLKREVIDVERSGRIPVVGPLALALPPDRIRNTDERAIRSEIRALEAERDALKAEKRSRSRSRHHHHYIDPHDHHDHHHHHHDHHGHVHGHSETDLVIYDRETLNVPGEEYTLVRREKITESEPDGGVRIQKDKKGRMSITVPKYI